MTGDIETGQGGDLHVEWLKDGRDQLLTDLRVHLDAQRWDDVARIIDDYFFALSLTAPDTVAEIWARVPREWLIEHPRYLMASSLTRAAGSGFSLIGERTERLFADWVSRQEQPATRDILAMKMAAIRRYLVAGRFDRATATAEEAREVLRVAQDQEGFDDILGPILSRIGTTALLAGDLTRAIESFSEGWRWASTFPHPMAPYLAGHCALSHALAGDYTRAEAWLSRSRHASVTDQASPAFPLQEAGRLAEALVHIGRLDAAGAELSVMALPHGVAAGELGWVGTHARARFALYWGDSARAARELESELDAFPSLTGAGSLAGMMLRADLSDLHQAEGDLQAAEDALTPVDPSQSHPAVASSRARILLVQGKPTEALAVLESAHRCRRTSPRAPARWQVLRANAARLARSSDSDHAARLAADSVEQTGAYDATQEALPEVHEAIAARVALPAAATNGFTPPATMALTPREEQILQLLRSHTSVRALADAMYISANTAKSHLRNLYRKLGVSSRLDALRRVGLAPAPGDADQGSSTQGDGASSLRVISG